MFAKWNAIFASIPMESILYQNRSQYYQAIEDACNTNGSGVFIEFTLLAGLNSLIDQEKHQVKHEESSKIVTKINIKLNWPRHKEIYWKLLKVERFRAKRSNYKSFNP